MKRAFALIAVLAVAASHAAAHDRPLGDGRISSAAQRGYVYSCQQRFNPNAGGAHLKGEWIGADSYNPAAKPTVDGSVTWPSEISVSLENGKRVVRANNLPQHPTGQYPVQRSDDAYRYDRNPNAIAGQDILLVLPAVPQEAASPSCVPMGMVGFMLSGAALFNAVDAVGRDAPAWEIQDACSGHPERTGQYHYHDLSPCIEDTRSQPGGHSDLIGYALDGFGIFGEHGEGGHKLTNADLDACHGHTHEMIWDGRMRTIYHYHMTGAYPYSIGCFRSQPVRTAQGTQGYPKRAGMRKLPPRRFGAPRPPGGGLPDAKSWIGQGDR